MSMSALEQTLDGKWTEFIDRFYPKCFTIFPDNSPVHAHIHRPTAESATRGDSQLVRARLSPHLDPLDAHGALKELLEGAGEEERDGEADATVQRHCDEDAPCT